jgi:hypothetical protein
LETPSDLSTFNLLEKEMTKKTKPNYGVIAKHSIVKRPLPQLELINPAGDYPFGSLKFGDEALVIEGRTLVNIVRHIRNYMTKNGGLFLAFEEKGTGDTPPLVLVYRIEKGHKYASLAVSGIGGKGKKKVHYRPQPTADAAPAPVPVVTQSKLELAPAAPKSPSVSTKKPLVKNFGKLNPRGKSAPVVLVDEVYAKPMVQAVEVKSALAKGRVYPNPINAEEILKLYESGRSAEGIAADYKISIGYVYSLTSRARKARQKATA